MAAIDRALPIAVTGAAGFVGGWVVRDLLERGYRVRACVRDPEDTSKVGFLRAMPAFASGRLTLHAADVDQPGCYDEIFAGCGGVAHVAHVSTYDDVDYVTRTCDHIAASIERSGSVSRAVVTSSIAAVISEADITELARRPLVDEDRFPDEAHPKRTTDRGQGYSIGKVIAERAFAEAAAAGGGHWDAITVCPGDNVGPIQSAHQRRGGPWQALIAEMLRGNCVIHQGTGPYRPWMTVDVRDDAAAHVGLLESEQVGNGERYLAISTEMWPYEAIVAAIGTVLPELDYDSGPIRDEAPDRWKAREDEFRSIWDGLDLRNDRIRAATGMTFRPFEDSLRDCVESLIAIGGIEVHRHSE